MKLNTPFPQPLPKECLKAAKIFKSFVDSSNNGLDGVIPRHILENAKGFAIFTIVKAGFLFSARAGSGVVIAKLEDGSWSCPSAIGTAGVGVGGQLGAEVTDFLVVLNSRSAVKSFMSAGSLTLGGNMSIAVGPLGRNGEASGSVNTKGKLAAMYSYSKTRGLFGGVSIEGSVIMERQDANALAYQFDASAKMLLTGAVDPPEWAKPLITTLESCTGMPGGRKWVNDVHGSDHGHEYAFGQGVSSPSTENSPARLNKKKRSLSAQFPPAAWGRRKSSGSYFVSDTDSHQSSDSGATPWKPTTDTTASRFETHFESDFDPFSEDQASRKTPHMKSMSLDARNLNLEAPTPSSPKNPFRLPSSDGLASQERPSSDAMSPTTTKPHLTPKAGLSSPLDPTDGIARAIALYDFTAVERGDLSFTKGTVITITKKSDSTNDWWTGKANGAEGTFPANFVEVV